MTRRLDTRAAAVARLFYPDLDVNAAMLPGVRELRLGWGGKRLDTILDLTARDGWAHGELPPRFAETQKCREGWSRKT